MAKLQDSVPFGKYRWTVHCVILGMTTGAWEHALFASTMICILIAWTTYSIVKFNETYLHNDPGKNDFNHKSLKKYILLNRWYQELREHTRNREWSKITEIHCSLTLNSCANRLQEGRRDRHKDKGYVVPPWRVSLQVMLPKVWMENPGMHPEEIEQSKM